MLDGRDFAARPTTVVGRYTPGRTKKIVLPPVVPHAMLTEADLVADTEKLLPHLACVDAIVGVARSGLLPAAMLATRLHVPLYSGMKRRVAFVGHGTRSTGMDAITPRSVAVVDDTTVSGRSIANVAKAVAQKWPDAEIVTVALYADKPVTDIVGRIYHTPHFLSWNLFNSTFVSHAALDIDGVLATGGKFVNFPRYREVPVIVSCRGESARGSTEKALQASGIRYKQLLLSPEFCADDDEAGQYKASALQPYVADGTVRYMVESEPRQAEIIARATGIVTVCYKSCEVHNVL